MKRSRYFPIVSTLMCRIAPFLRCDPLGAWDTSNVPQTERPEQVPVGGPRYPSGCQPTGHSGMCIRVRWRRRPRSASIQALFEAHPNSLMRPVVQYCARSVPSPAACRRRSSPSKTSTQCFPCSIPLGGGTSPMHSTNRVRGKNGLYVRSCRCTTPCHSACVCRVVIPPSMYLTSCRFSPSSI